MGMKGYADSEVGGAERKDVKMNVWEATRAAWLLCAASASAHGRATGYRQWLHFARSMFARQAASSMCSPKPSWSDFTSFHLLPSNKSPFREEQNRMSGNGVGWLTAACTYHVCLSQHQSSRAAETNTLHCTLSSQRKSYWEEAMGYAWPAPHLQDTPGEIN